MGTQCVRPSGRPDKNRAQSDDDNVLQTNPKAQSYGQTNPKQTGKQNSNSGGLQINGSGSLMTMNANQAELHCMICKEKYNTIQRQPVTVCQQDHTICQHCKNMLLSTKIERYKICPFCKHILKSQDIIVNQTLLQRIQRLP